MTDLRLERARPSFPTERGGRGGRRRRFAILGSRGYPSTYGGFETFVRRLAPYLVDAGAEVTVYGRDAERPGHHTAPDGVHVVNTRGYDTRSASTLSHGRAAALHAAQEGYDAALVLNCAMGFWLPGLRAAGIPTLLNVDGIEWERDKWSAVGKWVFRQGAQLCARHADRLVADSVGIQDYWRRTFGTDTTFIPYGADVLGTLDHDRLADLDLHPGGFVLAVARLVPENNVELLLEAVQRARHRYPVVIVGSAAPGDPLAARLEAAGRGADVRWLGHVSDQRLLEQLWQHCGVYVHGHSVGGTNPGLLQALGAGSPTVVLDTVYNREVVAAACPTFGHDPDDLAARIDLVMGDETLRTRLRAAGREVVRTRYSWDDVCRDYLVELEALAVLRKNHHRWLPRELAAR